MTRLAPLNIDGLVPATYTPMHGDGRINLPAIAPMVDFLVTQGVAGMYVLGSTGEGPSLTFDERCQVGDAFVKAAAGRIPVIIQVGSESVVQSQQLAAHAQAIGAAAISAVSPVYFKPDSLDSLIAFMRSVAGSAPQLPFYYYHIPMVTGLPFAAVDFLRNAAKVIPTLCGMKFTSTVLHELQACLELDPDRLEILFGCDEMLLGALAVGCRGAVGSTYNYAAPLYQQMLAAWRSGDLETARRYQSQSQAMVRAFCQFGPRAAQKSIMQMIGLPCGPSRLPIPEFSRSEYEGLESSLRNIGFFDWLNSANKKQV